MRQIGTKARGVFGTAGRGVVSAMLLFALLAGMGCSAGDTSSQEEIDDSGNEMAPAAFPVTVTDDVGRTVTVPSEPMRIVSLAPANTEIVYALDRIDRLVGVTTYDDYPPEVDDIEKIGDFVQPNIEAIAAAAPDLILATAGVQADVVEQLEGTGAIVIAIDPQSLDALFTSIETVGRATGAVDEAAEVLTSMREDLAALQDAIEATGAGRVRCFLEIAQDPLFTAGEGTLLHDLVVAAGGENIVKEPGYVGFSLEQLVTDDPEVYLATMGSMSNPEDLAARPGYDRLSAVTTGRVAVLEDNLVSRPGPRVIQGVRQIAEALHPAAFE